MSLRRNKPILGQRNAPVRIPSGLEVKPVFFVSKNLAEPAFGTRTSASLACQKEVLVAPKKETMTLAAYPFLGQRNAPVRIPSELEVKPVFFVSKNLAEPAFGTKTSASLACQKEVLVAPYIYYEIEKFY